LHSQGTQPIYPTLKVPALPNYDGAKSKLTHQTAAVPTGRERRHHNQLAVAFLPACISERIRLSMYGRIALLHAAIVSSADQLARLIENGSTDGNAAFFEAKARFRKSNNEQGVVVQCGTVHDANADTVLACFLRFSIFGIGAVVFTYRKWAFALSICTDAPYTAVKGCLDQRGIVNSRALSSVTGVVAQMKGRTRITSSLLQR
jgi:hypothetical protein